MKNKNNNKPDKISARLVLPFFIVMFILAAISFAVPLRPVISNAEKRELAKFPEFSVNALISGSYFDDITLWYSDTFPGRESWILQKNKLERLYGISDVAISGVIPEIDETPFEKVPSGEDIGPEAASEASEKDAHLMQDDWGDISFDTDAEVLFGTVMQIDDTAFHYFGHSEYWSDYYVDTVNRFAEVAGENGVRVINCLIPPSVGIWCDKDYAEQFGCADSQVALDYINDRLNDNVVCVNMIPKLKEHKDEYIFFRTDHHWSGLGAYYGYEALCEAAGRIPAAKSDFEEQDQGPFIGSLYLKAPNTAKLKEDHIFSLNPPGDISMKAYTNWGEVIDCPVILDKSKDSEYNKYVCYLGGDYPMCCITNNDIHDDSACLIIKDSFGNPVAPLLTQNYHTVYVVDFRHYVMPMNKFIEEYRVDDFIFMPMLGMVQERGANGLIRQLCGFPC